MFRSYVQTNSDDELEVPQSVYMSDKTLHSLRTKGRHETDIDNRSIDSNSLRLQINGDVFQMDDVLVNSTDSQYERFLLDVERANNELFINNAMGETVSFQEYKGESSDGVSTGYLAMTAGSKVDFDRDTYEDDEGEEYVVEKDDLQEAEFDDGDEDFGQDGGTDGDDEQDDDAIEMDPNEELPITSVQKVSAGYIINSNVYLTVPQWHALIPEPAINQTYCVVCDQYIDFDTDNVHIEEPEHLDNLKLYKPLKRFELSITRLFRTIYHCGICNELFDDRDDDHVDTKQHGDRMLFAINKASDLVYDYRLDRRQDSGRLNEDLQRQPQETMTYPLNNPTDNATSYSSCFTKPDRGNDHKYQSNDPYDRNYPSNDRYGGNDRFDREFQCNDHYDSEFPSNDQSDYRNDQAEQSNDQGTGISYAAMAKKLKMGELPDMLKIDLGDKLVTVKFDSWHMIISTGLNQIYCMACQLSQHKRVKADHCRSSPHLEKLMKCSVVELYGTHLIRKVGEQLYHCGHCNNLQPIDLMEEHVELYHPRNPRTPAKPATNTEPVAPNRVSDNSATSQVQENVRSMADVAETNSPSVRKTGLAKIMELTQHAHKNVGVVPKTKPVTLDNDFTSSNSRVVKKLDEESEETPPNVGFFKSVWGDAGLNSPVTPQSKPDVEKKMAASPQTREASQTAKDEKFGVSTPQNSKEGSPIPREVVSNVEKKPMPSTSILNNLNPASKLTPMINFHPDFEKTIYQFGYKLSIHILSLNAIIKMHYGDNTKVQFYRCVFCNLDVEERLLLEHMLDIRHVSLIPTSPYMPEFSLHLIRQIRVFIHCAICNLILPSDQLTVLNHNASLNHTTLLKRAIGYVSPIHSPGPIQAPHTAGLPSHPPLPPLIPLPPTANVLPPLLHNPAVAPTFPPVPPTFPPVTPTFPPVTPTLQPVAPFPPQMPTLSPNVANGVSTSPASSVAGDKCETPDGKKAKKQKAVTATDEVLVNYTEDCYLVKQRKHLHKVQRDSLNTILYCGDGTLYCFVCEGNIGAIESAAHIEDRRHRKCLTDSKMLNNYGNSLLRQIENMYHCATCNVIVQKKYLQRHLDWYKHLKNLETTLCHTESDKLTEDHDEIPRIDVPTQKERLNVKDRSKFVIHFAFVIDKNHSRNDANDNRLYDGDCEDGAAARLNKIVIVKDEVFKLKWEHWHGLTTFKDGYRCKICGVDFDVDYCSIHLQEARHATNLSKPFVEELDRDLLRQVSESKLHCLICNIELSTSDNICEHLDGKRHNKNRDQIIEDSAKVNAYSDCDKDVLFL